MYMCLCVCVYMYYVVVVTSEIVDDGLPAAAGMGSDDTGWSVLMICHSYVCVYSFPFHLVPTTHTCVCSFPFHLVPTTHYVCVFIPVPPCPYHSYMCISFFSFPPCTPITIICLCLYLYSIGIREPHMHLFSHNCM